MPRLGGDALRGRGGSPDLARPQGFTLKSRAQVEADAAAKVEKARPKTRFEAETAEELAELKARFDAAKQKNAQRRETIGDTEYWMQVVFATKADRNKFLELLGLDGVIDDQYLDGYALAAACNVKLPLPLSLPKGHTIVSHWEAIALPITASDDAD